MYNIPLNVPFKYMQLLKHVNQKPLARNHNNRLFKSYSFNDYKSIIKSENQYSEVSCLSPCILSSHRRPKIISSTVYMRQNTCNSLLCGLTHILSFREALLMIWVGQKQVFETKVGEDRKTSRFCWISPHVHESEIDLLVRNLL